MHIYIVLITEPDGLSVQTGSGTTISIITAQLWLIKSPDTGADDSHFSASVSHSGAV